MKYFHWTEFKLGREREREWRQRHYAILASLGKKLGFKEVSYKTSSRAEAGVSSASPLFSGFLHLDHTQDPSSTMVLTHVGWENKGAQDLFLRGLKLTSPPHLCVYNLAYVCSVFQVGDALFLRAQTKFRG